MRERWCFNIKWVAVSGRVQLDCIEEVREEREDCGWEVLRYSTVGEGYHW
jgi:hypothetical protein